MCRENRQTVGNGESVGYYIGQARAEKFDAAILRLYEKLGAWLRANREDELYDPLSELHRELQKYTAILARYDEKFITYIEEDAEDTRISLICIDPSEVVGEMLDKGRASLLFSATLTPISYFSDLLGGDKSATFLELPSPYAAENLCVAAVDSISTRFEDRDKTYKKAATYIAAAVSAKKGNYMVYFPSYGYLEKVQFASGNVDIMPTSPIEMKSVGELKTVPAEGVGAHTRKVLAELGYSEQQINAMMEAGAAN
jgi:Rad3-related DNA helicase